MPSSRTMRKPIEVKPAFWLFILLLACCLPETLVSCYLLAALAHELAHVASAYGMGGKLQRICFGFADLKMEFWGLDYRKERICALAGPLFNLLLSAIFRRYGLFCVCNLLLGLYNFLPVLPLDGGRALLNLVLCKHDPEAAQNTLRLVGRITCGLLLTLGALEAAVFHNGWFLLILGATVTLRQFHNDIEIYPVLRYNKKPE